MAAQSYSSGYSRLQWTAVPEPRCRRCGSNARLVAYRRNGGEHEWDCASCTGSERPRGVPSFDVVRERYRDVPGFGELVRRVGRARATSRAVMGTLDRKPAEMSKRRYTGPRAHHDPLR